MSLVTLLPKRRVVQVVTRLYMDLIKMLHLVLLKSLPVILKTVNP